MKIGISICMMSLVNLIYLYFGGEIGVGYIVGNFLGGVVVAFIEIALSELSV